MHVRSLTLPHKVAWQAAWRPILHEPGSRGRLVPEVPVGLISDDVRHGVVQLAHSLQDSF